MFFTGIDILRARCEERIATPEGVVDLEVGRDDVREERDDEDVLVCHGGGKRRESIRRWFSASQHKRDVVVEEPS